MLAGGVDEHPALTQRERDGFFDVDVLAGEHRGAGHGGVPVIGGGDEDDVDIVTGDEVLKLGVDIHALIGTLVLVGGVGFFDAVADFDGLAAPDIGHGEDAAVVTAEQRADVSVADEAVAYEADGEAVAGRVFTEERGRENIRGDGVGEDAGEPALEDGAAGEGRGLRMRHEVRGMKYEGEADTTGPKGTAHRLANAGCGTLANQGEKTTVAEEKLCAAGSP